MAKKKEKPVRLDEDLRRMLQQSRLCGKNHMTGHEQEAKNNDRLARFAAERVQARIDRLEARIRELEAQPKENDDLFVVRVGRAGIGRLGYRAYFNEAVIDRSDGDDSRTYRTPGKALIKLAKKFDKELVQYGWGVLDSLKDSRSAAKGVKQRVIQHLYGDGQ